MKELFKKIFLVFICVIIISQNIIANNNINNKNVQIIEIPEVPGYTVKELLRKKTLVNRAEINASLASCVKGEIRELKKYPGWFFVTVYTEPKVKINGNDIFQIYIYNHIPIGYELLVRVNQLYLTNVKYMTINYHDNCYEYTTVECPPPSYPYMIF